MKTYVLLLAAASVLVSTGCPGGLVKTKPSSKFAENELTSRINAYLTNRQLGYYCAINNKQVGFNYGELAYTCGNGAADPKVSQETARRIRNEAIENGIMAVNSVYTDFVDDLNTGRATGNFIADVVDLGMGAAIGITNGERALQVLGVSLTAFRGGRHSVDVNFFKEQTTPILINKMDDNRSIVYASILLKKKKSVDEYPMTEAIRDVVDYYNAGTLVRALTQLSKDTGEKANQSAKTVLQLQKIDPADFVEIDDVDASAAYGDFLHSYTTIVKAGSSASAAEQDAAAQRLRQIYKDISGDPDLSAAVAKAKADNPVLVSDMDKLAGDDDTKAAQVTGIAALSIVNKVYKSIDISTGGTLVKKLVDHFTAHAPK